MKKETKDELAARRRALAARRKARLAIGAAPPSFTILPKPRKRPKHAKREEDQDG